MTMTFTAGGQAAGNPNVPVRRPHAEGYNLRMANKWFRTVAGPGVELTIATQDSLASRQQESGTDSIYSNVLDLGYAWARTDVSGGEGLDWDPREISIEREAAALDIIKFWDSDGLDIRRPDTAGQRYNIRLSRTFEQWSLVTTDPRDITSSLEFIYVADGDTITWYTGWSDTTPVGSDTPAGNIKAIVAAPNDTVVAVLDDGSVWAKLPTEVVWTATPAPASGFPAQGVWFVNGRFVVSTFETVGQDAAELYEVLYDGATWVAGTPFATATSEFVSVVESGPAIVAACLDGTVRTYVPDLDNDLAPQEQSRTTMPDGETPVLLGSNAGILLIMTVADRDEVFDPGGANEPLQDIRLYQAEVLDARFQYVVGSRQLKREWVGATVEPDTRRNMPTTRDEVYWFVRELRATDENSGIVLSEALWRFDLVTTGLNRVVSDGTTDLQSLIIFEDRAGGINFTDSNILISSDTTYQPFGYMIFPNLTFGLNTPITWLATVLEAQNISFGGAQVELYRTSDIEAILDPWSDSWVIEQRISAQGQSGIEKPMVGVESRTLALQLRVYPSQGATETPRVTRTAIRGIPAHRDLVMVVPVNVSDYVSVPGRKPIRQPHLGDSIHRELLSLVGSGVEAILLDPPTSLRGIINNVSEPIQFLSDRGSVSRYCLVEIRGNEFQQTIPPVGDEGVGLGLLGVSTVGIGQSVGT